MAWMKTPLSLCASVEIWLHLARVLPEPCLDVIWNDETQLGPDFSTVCPLLPKVTVTVSHHLRHHQTGVTMRALW